MNIVTYSQGCITLTNKIWRTFGLRHSVKKANNFFKNRIMKAKDKLKKGDSPAVDEKPSKLEIEKSKAHIIVEIIEYMANSVVIKTILKKSTGNISVMSFDSGEGLTVKTSPFDSFAQIIEGQAEVVIDKISHMLESGQGIVIPANTPNFIKPNGRFKMIQTIIKSGYE